MIEKNDFVDRRGVNRSINRHWLRLSEQKEEKIGKWSRRIIFNGIVKQ